MENSKIYKLLPQNINFHTSRGNSQCYEHQVSLNFKCAKQMEGMECSEKISNVKNWKHISKRNLGASISNFGTFWKLLYLLSSRSIVDK